MASQAPQTTSKSSKRKSKLVDRAESPAPAPTVEKAPSVEGSDDDSAYTKELLKNIRNANKKLANTAKYDDIVKGHPGKTLDELVANKVINADQKAAILKKPNLQAQLAQLQDQLAQVKKIESDYRARIKTEKEEHEKALKDKYEAEKAEALEELRNGHKKAVDDGFLAVSQFLRLAAARRTEEADPNLEENQALEGVLLILYTGDETAVEAMNKLVSGSQEQTMTTANEPLSVTYAQVKAAAEAYRVALFGEPQSDAEAAAAADTDPTIAHAGLTEINAGDTTTVAEAQETQASFASEPPKTEVVATTEPVAPTTENAELTGSQLSDWEVVAAPREQETDSATPVPEQDKPETKEQDKPEAQEQEQEQEQAQAPADPAELQGSSSWADDHAAEPAAAASPQTDNEGFHQVQRRRGHGDGHSNWRGRGRGEGRGRGFRGDFRGRGRGYRHRGDYQGRGDYHGRGDHQGRGDYQGRPRRGGGESS